MAVTAFEFGENGNTTLMKTVWRFKTKTVGTELPGDHTSCKKVCDVGGWRCKGSRKRGGKTQREGKGGQ